MLGHAHVISTTSDPAPVGSAGTDPLVPYQLGFIDPNHDNGNTTNDQIDLPG